MNSVWHLIIQKCQAARQANNNSGTTPPGANQRGGAPSWPAFLAELADVAARDSTGYARGVKERVELLFGAQAMPRGDRSSAPNEVLATAASAGVGADRFANFICRCIQ